MGREGPGREDRASRHKISKVHHHFEVATGMFLPLGLDVDHLVAPRPIEEAQKFHLRMQGSCRGAAGAGHEAKMSHLDLMDKTGCISYMRQRRQHI
jgi:hypothetical protein